MNKNTYEGIDPKIVKIIQKTAAKVIGKSGFTQSDLPDIEQELIIAALEGLKCLRENVENEEAFASQIVNNRLRSIFRERNRKSRKWNNCCFSLNIPIELDNGDIDELMNLVDNDHLLRNNSYSFPNPYLDIDLVDNINVAILKFPKSLQILCEELKKRSIRDVMRENNMTQERIYRKIRQIRKMLKKQEALIFLSE
jgi:hypothetical protein